MAAFVTGTDARNPLVVHGPIMQHALELWVEAGIPPAIALKAAISDAMKALSTEKRFGTMRKGMGARRNRPRSGSVISSHKKPPRATAADRSRAAAGSLNASVIG